MAPMPAVMALIVCKVVLAGPPDQNTNFTHWENLDWATENAMMHCRREEVPLYDRAVDAGAAPRPFTPNDCWRSAFSLGPAFDAAHHNSAWRFWRVACPVPIVRKNPDGSEDIIAWKVPECGRRETVVCETDSAI